MKARLFALLIVLLPSIVSAQYGSPFGIHYTPPGLTFNGTYFSSAYPIVLPDGSQTLPSVGSVNNASGIYFSAPGQMDFTTNGTRRAYMSSAGFTLSTIPLRFGSSADLYVYRDAADTLALRRGGTAGVPVPQVFNLYKFCDGASCATGYELAFLDWTTTANFFTIGTRAAGTGTARSIKFAPASGYVTWAAGMLPASNDVYDLGYPSGASIAHWANIYVDRSLQGSRSKALTESSATSTWDCAIAAGSYLSGDLIYSVYAADGTDQQVRESEVHVTAANKAGTTTCNLTTLSGSTGADVDETHDGNSSVITAGTLTYEITCADTTDSFAVKVNAVSSLAQTSLVSLSRWDQLTVQTCTPQ